MKLLHRRPYANEPNLVEVYPVLVIAESSTTIVIRIPNGIRALGKEFLEDWPDYKSLGRLTLPDWLAHRLKLIE